MYLKTIPFYDNDSYHDQLVAASKKVPFKEAGGVHVTFTWKDSLQKGKFLSSTPKLSRSTCMCCIRISEAKEMFFLFCFCKAVLHKFPQ